MGRFASIINRWRSTADDRRIRLALGTLRPTNGQLLRNLEADPNIADAVLEDLLKAWLRCDPTDVVVLIDEYTGFCSRHKYGGSIDPKAVNRRLGHVMTRVRLQRIIESLGSFTAGGSDARRATENVLRWDLDTQKRRLKSVTLTPKEQMWSFYDADAPDPFRSIGRRKEVLRRRLGMGHIPSGTPLLTLVHRLPPRVSPFVPTTFDAETYEYFRPGGRTRPLGRSHRPGMPEVVHKPSTGAHLEEAICAAIT